MMKFEPNKTPAEVINEGTFGGTYVRDVYSGVSGKCYQNSWKEFDFLKNVDHKFYASNFYDVKVNKYCVKCGTSLRFWENKGWICGQDPYGWFQWYCRYYSERRSSDDERQIKRWNGIVSRFKGILVSMIKNKGAKFDDYFVSPKIRQVLLYWGYELVINDIQQSLFLVLVSIINLAMVFLLNQVYCKKCLVTNKHI